jgi:hypothetical protein
MDLLSASGKIAHNSCPSSPPVIHPLSFSSIPFASRPQASAPSVEQFLAGGAGAGVHATPGKSWFTSWSMDADADDPLPSFVQLHLEPRWCLLKSPYIMVRGRRCRRSTAFISSPGLLFIVVRGRYWATSVGPNCPVLCTSPFHFFRDDVLICYALQTLGSLEY